MVLPIAENPFLRPAKPRFTSSQSNPNFTVVNWEYCMNNQTKD
jgi:hypothetical protein